MNRLQRTNNYTNSTVSATQMLFSSAVTAGSSIIVTICSAKVLTSLSDNRGNLYTKNAQIFQTGGTNVISFWLATNAAAGSTTLTATQSGTGTRPICWSATEIDTTLEYDNSRGSSSAINSLFPATGAITPMQLNEETYTVAATHTGIIFPTTFVAQPAGWDVCINSNLRGPGAQAAINEWITSWTTGASAQWTISPGRAWIAAAASYRPPRVTVPGSPQWQGYTIPFHRGLPMLPGLPWFDPMWASRGDVAGEDPPEAQPDLYLVPPIPDPQDEVRLAESLRKVSEMLNSLARQLQLFQSSANETSLRGRGLSGTSDPGVDNDLRTGAGYGTIYVNRSDSTAPKVFVCTSPASGAATWVRLKLVTTGSATGTF